MLAMEAVTVALGEQQRGSWRIVEGAIRDTSGPSTKTKFLGLCSAAVGITLGGNGIARSTPSGCRSWNRPVCKKSGVTEKLASLTMALHLRSNLSDPDESLMALVRN